MHVFLLTYCNWYLEEKRTKKNFPNKMRILICIPIPSVCGWQVPNAPTHIFLGAVVHTVPCHDLFTPQRTCRTTNKNFLSALLTHHHDEIIFNEKKTFCMTIKWSFPMYKRAFVKIRNPLTIVVSLVIGFDARSINY